MMSCGDYETAVLQTLWTWADRHHGGELDGGKQQGRPPVLERGVASKTFWFRRTGRKRMKFVLRSLKPAASMVSQPEELPGPGAKRVRSISRL